MIGKAGVERTFSNEQKSLQQQNSQVFAHKRFDTFHSSLANYVSGIFRAIPHFAAYMEHALSLWE